MKAIFNISIILNRKINFLLKAGKLNLFCLFFISNVFNSFAQNITIEVKSDGKIALDKVNVLINNKISLKTNANVPIIWNNKNRDKIKNIEVISESLVQKEWNYFENDSLIVVLMEPQNDEVEKSQNSQQVSTLLEKAETKIQVKDSIIISYKDEIVQLSEEINSNKGNIEENNILIKNKIEKIIERLKSNKSLSSKEKAEIQRYLFELEKSILQSKLIFEKSQTQVSLMLGKLKYILSEKDSINELANEKILLLKRKSDLEKDEQRKMFYFLGLSALVFIAIIVLILYLQIRKRNKGLEEWEIEKKLAEAQSKNIKWETFYNEISLAIQSNDNNFNDIQSILNKNKNLLK